MEMVKTEIRLLAAGAVLLMGLASCSSAPVFTWESYNMDGSRTGVSAPSADNVKQALGELDDSVYVAPNGRVFAKGSATYEVAADMIGVQDEMAPLKEVIGYATREMPRRGPNCELSNWLTDKMRSEIARLTGKRVDVAIINNGGIRVDLPQGTVIKDDLVSMLPFKNYLSYVSIKGEDLIYLFDDMARKGMMPFSGAKVVMRDRHTIDTLLVGGKPVDPKRYYGVGTIDFLLDGGDKLSIGRNARDLIITNCLLIDVMLPYAQSYAERGENIEYVVDDGRFVPAPEPDQTPSEQ